VETILIIIVLVLLFGGGGGYFGRSRGYWWPDAFLHSGVSRDTKATSPIRIAPFWKSCAFIEIVARFYIAHEW